MPPRSIDIVVFISQFDLIIDVHSTHCAYINVEPNGGGDSTLTHLHD